ncbi:hypothetical protein ACJX0J_020428 [Zea mays]
MDPNVCLTYSLLFALSILMKEEVGNILIHINMWQELVKVGRNNNQGLIWHFPQHFVPNTDEIVMTSNLKEREDEVKSKASQKDILKLRSEVRAPTEAVVNFELENPKKIMRIHLTTASTKSTVEASKWGNKFLPDIC